MSKLFNLVKINTATTGTGTVTFGAAVGPDFFTPNEVGVADGNTVSYILIDGTDVELGTGVVGGSVTTMSRTVVQSRIGGVAGTTKLNLSGTAILALTVSAADIANVIRVQKFTASGTYTPDANLLYAIIESIGAGGGGGAVSGTSSQLYQGGGGGSGSYSRGIASAADIGASQTVTIGAAGTGGASGTNNGGDGGATSVGTLVTTNGGKGGKFGSASQVGVGGAGGAVGTGNIAAPGAPGGSGLYNAVNASIAFSSGNGGSSAISGGAPGVSGSGGLAGVAATGYGGGGSGASSNGAGTLTAAGGNGAPGVVIITEFCSE